MIVTCPNCAARYRLPDEVLAKKGRLRCAACDHRWVPEMEVAPEPPKRGAVTEADEEAAFLAVQEQIRARWHDEASPTPVPPPKSTEASIFDEPADDETKPQTESDSPRVLRTIVALIAGIALSIAAAGLWIGREDLAVLPVIGQALQNLAPASPVTVLVVGETTLLPSGRHVLEVSGTIANRAKTVAAVPSLAARLSGPQGVALRWTIPAPVASLQPGQQVAFSSTVTGFPTSAQTLTVRPGR